MTFQSEVSQYEKIYMIQTHWYKMPDQYNLLLVQVRVLFIYIDKWLSSVICRLDVNHN